MNNHSSDISDEGFSFVTSGDWLWERVFPIFSDISDEFFHTLREKKDKRQRQNTFGVLSFVFIYILS